MMRHFGDVSAQFLGVDPSSVYWTWPVSLCHWAVLDCAAQTVTSRPAYWSSWADCLGMVQQRHPAVSRRIVHALNAHHPGFHLAGVRASRAHLTAAGFVAPSWGELADGIRPEHFELEVDKRTADVPIHGWQIEDDHVYILV